MPLANSFLRGPDEFGEERCFPLDMVFCEKCSLVQLLDVIDPEVLFRNYIYVSGVSETIAAHNTQYARTVVDRLNLRKEDLVIEVGSNDGSLLKCFREHGVKTVGIEPAANIVRMARSNGIETINAFFNCATAQEVAKSFGRAKVIIANNVMGHVDETRDFLWGCKLLLAEDGLVVVEVPYLRELIDRLEYDTVYHEHLCYFSVSALMYVCDAVGLSIVRMDPVSVHGGSIRMYAGSKKKHWDHAESVVALADEERAVGLTELSRYELFARDVDDHRRSLLNLLETLKREGNSLAGYGAPAKGNTLLNYCAIHKRVMPYTVDKNPMKIGLYTPGMHIPVLPVSTLLERQPDYVMILAWNFADEIMRQQREYRDRGGRFIIPIPEPRVV